MSALRRGQRFQMSGRRWRVIYVNASRVSLRDYFAAHALGAVIITARWPAAKDLDDRGVDFVITLARAAYMFAEAMLDERERDSSEDDSSEDAS